MTQDEAIAALAALGLTEAEGYPLIGSECPVEAEAWLGNARLYFRSRGSQWKLEIYPRGFSERALYWVASYGQGKYDDKGEQMVTFTFDVESIGLHGEGFAVGWCVHQDGIETHSGVFACPPIAARGTDANREWVHANIPEIAPNQHGPEGVRAAFWAALQEAKRSTLSDEAMIVLADCGWPVEARFLSACVDDRPDEREWQGPYPLHDLATYLLAAGCDPTGHYERRPEEMPVHDPLADARQTARIFWELRRGILPIAAK